MSKRTRFKETKRCNRYGATFHVVTRDPFERWALQRAVIFKTKHPDKVELALKKQAGKGVDVGIIGLGTYDKEWLASAKEKCSNTTDFGVIELEDIKGLK